MVKIKKSEARIMIYLGQVDKPFKYTQMISNKLQIDYTYLRQLLAQMYEKSWVEKFFRDGKVFYELTTYAPLMEAKELLGGENGVFESETQEKLDK